MKVELHVFGGEIVLRYAMQYDLPRHCARSCVPGFDAEHDVGWALFARVHGSFTFV